MKSNNFFFNDHIINQKYSDYFQPINQNIFRIIESRLLQFNKTLSRGKILDFGCNIANLLTTSNGEISYPSYVGIDINKKAISVGTRMYPEARFIHYNRYNCTFNPDGVKGLEIPLLREKFDIIVVYGVFTHFFWDEIIATIQELLKHLSKDGSLVFSMWEVEDFTGYKEFLLEKFGIDLRYLIPGTCNKGFHLIDRSFLLTDFDTQNKENDTNYDWVESFYRKEFVLDQIRGSVRTEGEPSYHPIYIINK